MKRFIFLDIDGVLASDEEWGIFLDDRSCAFNRGALDNLEYIIESVPDTKIIISSTWRKGQNLDDLQYLFKRRDFKYWQSVAGRTEILSFQPVRERCVESYMCTPRGCEIEEYIRFNTERTDQYKYVILDDGSDMMYWQRDNFVHVKEGLLTKENAEKAVEILK